MLTGPGGSGKSSLIGKILLDLEEGVAKRRGPFAYVDFDKARHDPNNPLGLLEQIARQLRLPFAPRRRAQPQFCRAGVDLGAARHRAGVPELLDLDTTQLDLEGLLATLSARLTDREPARHPADLGARHLRGGADAGPGPGAARFVA